MIESELLSMLWCPGCQDSELEYIPGEDGGDDEPGDNLCCVKCGARFPVHFGFPVLMPRASLTGDEWRLWEEHLRKFQARRQARIDNPDEPINRIAERSRPQEAFAEFVDIREGTILDLGCGPGKFRFHFDPERVRYVGLDPIVLPDVTDFPFVQGVAEYLPFKDGTFTDVVVLAALDHFRDLDRFLSEARRVLGPEGRLHILQSVHEIRGPISMSKVLAHKFKDAVEDWRTPAHARSIPKHLSEFTSRSLVGRLEAQFEVVASSQYSAAWYSPVKRFLTFAPKSGAELDAGSLSMGTGPSRQRELRAG